MKKQRVLWKDISSTTYIDTVLEDYGVENTKQKDIDNISLEFNKSLPFTFLHQHLFGVCRIVFNYFPVYDGIS